jgi:Rad3-related DNA helicase
MKDYCSKYPFEEFRPGIKEMLEKLAEYDSKRFFIIRGRTGSGKSGVSVAISRAYGCHILTATKMLQDQYASTPQFDLEFVLKGKGNYTCNITGQGAAEAPCSGKTLFQIGKKKHAISVQTPAELRADCVIKNGCEYYVKKGSLASTGGGILNYDLAFVSGFNGEAVVLDEAHNFIDKILDIYAIDISRKKLAQLVGITDTPNQTTLVEWLKVIQAKAAIKFEMAAAGPGRDQLKSLADKALTIISEKPLPGDFYVNADEEQIQIKPLFPHKIAHKFFNRFKKVFFLSATIDTDFAALLGLPPTQTIEYNLESTFPIENRPIYFPKDIPNLNMKSKIEKDLPQIEMLDAIIAAHQERGIIHTANYRIFMALQLMYRKNNRFTWVEQGKNKAELLAIHAAKPGSILVSPAMIEGVDLKDDLARWQVIFKIPFPAKTEYIQALESAMPGLYEATTRNNLVQAYGRPVRSETDWAHTYVLDGSLRFQLQKIDSYFAQAVKMGESEKLKEALKSGKIGGPIIQKKDTDVIL